MLSTGQQETSQACKTLVMKGIPVCPHLSGNSSTAVPFQWGTSDALNFGTGPVTTESELWRAQAFVLLMIPSRRFFMMN